VETIHRNQRCEVWAELVDNLLGDLGFSSAGASCDAKQVPLPGHRQRPGTLDKVGQA
jgi:hypothetical protein